MFFASAREEQPQSNDPLHLSVDGGQAGSFCQRPAPSLERPLASISLQANMRSFGSVNDPRGSVLI
jgi:hypothetical protein